MIQIILASWILTGANNANQAAGFVNVMKMSNLIPYVEERRIILLLIAGAGWLFQSAGACARPSYWKPTGSTLQTATFDRFTVKGEVLLKDGRRVRLAAVRMLDESTTGEPDLLSEIEKVVKRNGGEVRLATTQIQDNYVIYYCQDVYYREAYWPHIAIDKLFRPCRMATINELVIAMGAATLNNGTITLENSAMAALRVVQAKADEAKWNSRPWRKPADFLYPVYLYTNIDGFKARLTRASADTRDAMFVEFGLLKGELGSAMQHAARVESDWEVIIKALLNKNTFVRRFVVNNMSKTGQTDFPDNVESMLCNLALNDSDRVVREGATRIIQLRGTRSSIDCLSRGNP